MNLPTFLGIGAPRSGTTWLHLLLASHPKVYMPKHRKEILFFDLHYERGLGWYEKFFPNQKQVSQFQAIGEISPSYMDCPSCPERIAKIPSITKLIIILRHPVDRLFSSYGFHVQNRNYSASFEDFLASHPHSPTAIQRSFYSQYLDNYFRYFKIEQFLTLLHEQATVNLAETKERLACFLGLDPEEFPEKSGIKRVNKSYIPRLRSAYTLITELDWRLQQRGLDLGAKVLRKVRVNQMLFGEMGLPRPMKLETRDHLNEMYADEIKKLERLLQIDLGEWK